MKVLADTHAVLWWLADDPRLSDRARSTFRNGENVVYWSLASAFELAVKQSVGKLQLGRPLERLFAAVVQEQGFELLPVTHTHCTALAELPLHHRDPFDRMLVAQALIEGLPLLSSDSKLAAYDVELVW